MSAVVVGKITNGHPISRHRSGTDMVSSPIAFHTVDAFPAWKRAENRLRELIDTYRPTSILEIGSGANPTLPVEYVREAPFTYTTNDISAEELSKADPAYETLQLDACQEGIPENVHGAYDLIYSRMVNEHVQNGKQYYENIFSMLKPGGVTAHCFSTLYALPFLVNWLMPEFVSERILAVMEPRDKHQHDKFRAYYSWSRGPSMSMVRRFESIGYQVLKYDGFFGHSYYRKRLPWIDSLEKTKARFLSKYPISALTSYAFIVLQKPE